jgi:hypothetical protein
MLTVAHEWNRGLIHGLSVLEKGKGSSFSTCTSGVLRLGCLGLVALPQPKHGEDQGKTCDSTLALGTARQEALTRTPPTIAPTLLPVPGSWPSVLVDAGDDGRLVGEPREEPVVLGAPELKSASTSISRTF